MLDQSFRRIPPRFHKFEDDLTLEEGIINESDFDGLTTSHAEIVIGKARVALEALRGEQTMADLSCGFE